MPAANVAVARISACSWSKPASRKARRTAAMTLRSEARTAAATVDSDRAHSRMARSSIQCRGPTSAVIIRDSRCRGG